MRRSKIVCTLGPAVDSYEQLKTLIEAGMNVARFNMSHGTQSEHQERYERVRKAAEETGRAVGVLRRGHGHTSDACPGKHGRPTIRP